jgi:hypothetical protein
MQAIQIFIFAMYQKTLNVSITFFQIYITQAISMFILKSALKARVYSKTLISQSFHIRPAFFHYAKHSINPTVFEGLTILQQMSQKLCSNE